MLLALISFGFVGGSKFVLAQATKSVSQQNLLGDQGAKAKGHVTINGPQNILLLGLDNRPGQDPNAMVRADSVRERCSVRLAAATASSTRAGGKAQVRMPAVIPSAWRA